MSFAGRQPNAPCLLPPSQRGRVPSRTERGPAPRVTGRTAMAGGLRGGVLTKGNEGAIVWQRCAARQRAATSDARALRRLFGAARAAGLANRGGRTGWPSLLGDAGHDRSVTPPASGNGPAGGS